MIPGAYEGAGAFMSNLKKKVIIPGAGHWIQQERPKEINAILIEFLKSL
jgi:pimeloyl-ACP methyl ester carboxylesterase